MDTVSKEFKDYVTKYWEDHKEILLAIKRNCRTQRRITEKMQRILKNYTNSENNNITWHVFSHEMRALSELTKFARNDDLQERQKNMEKEYAAFMEKHGIDLDDRALDEDLWEFVNGLCDY